MISFFRSRLYDLENKADRSLSPFFPKLRETPQYVIADRCDSLTLWHISTALGAKIVAQSLNANLICVAEDKALHEPKSKILFDKSLNRKAISISDLTKKDQKTIQKITNSIFLKCKSPKDILQITFENLQIGQEIYDSVIKHKFCTVRKIDDSVRNEIYRAIRCIFGFKRITKQYNIIAGFCTHTSCSFDGVWLRYLLKMGIPVYQGFGGFGALVKHNPHPDQKRYEVPIHLRPPPELLKRSHPDFSLYLKKGKEYLKKKIKGNSKDWDAQKAYCRRLPLIKNRQNFAKKYNLSPKLPFVFIMLHAMNDDPHVKGQYLFNDYYDWYQFTLARLFSNKKCNWIFKIHPRTKFYPDDSDIIGDVNRSKISNVRILKENQLNTASIFYLAQTILTAGGTAGLEFTAFGIPAIICTKTGYHGLGLAYEPKDLEDYEDIIVKKCPLVLKISSQKKNQATVAFYLYNFDIKMKMINGFFNFFGNSQWISLSPLKTLSILLYNLGKREGTIRKEINRFSNAIKTLHQKPGTHLLHKSDGNETYYFYKL